MINSGMIFQRIFLYLIIIFIIPACVSELNVSQGGIGADYIINRRIRMGLRGVYRYNTPDIEGQTPNLSRFIITGRLGLDF